MSTILDVILIVIFTLVYLFFGYIALRNNLVFRARGRVMNKIHEMNVSHIEKACSYDEPFDSMDIVKKETKARWDILEEEIPYDRTLWTFWKSVASFESRAMNRLTEQGNE